MTGVGEEGGGAELAVAVVGEESEEVAVEDEPSVSCNETYLDHVYTPFLFM